MMSERRSGITDRRPRAETSTEEADTTGHNALAWPIGAPLELERRRQAEDAARRLGRVVDRRRRGVLERIHDRLSPRTEARR
jgi:hypothetical protein